MGEANITSVYDRLGETYCSSKHKSVKFSNDVQKPSLYYECVAQAERLDKSLEELDVLNIGVGGDRQRIDLCLHRDIFGQGRVSEHKLVDFDISQVMLDYAKKALPSKTYLKIVEKTKENIKQVKGDATELEKYFKKDTFDIIVAALCDHIQPQEKMYCGALNVLKEEGVLITTYPHKKLATVIRKDIYGINPSCTRYIIDGKEYLLHSYAALPEGISDLFTRTGFIDVQSRTLTANNIFLGRAYMAGVRGAKKAKTSSTFWWEGKGTCPSYGYAVPETMWKARDLLRVPMDELPVLVLGRGRKP